jgi:hypothetical protein
MIKTWQQRCEEHPDHNGIVTHRMIQQRMQEEIDDLRAAIEQAEKPMAKIEQAERDLIPQDKLFVSGQLGANVTRVRKERKWQGLTDEELEELSDADLGAYDLCLEVEAKLDERVTPELRRLYAENEALKTVVQAARDAYQRGYLDGIAKRPQPLTDEQIMDIVDVQRVKVGFDTARFGYRVSRAIEAAHGIGEKNG